MLKKITCLTAVLAVVLSFTVFAADDFLVYNEDTDRLCEVLNMDAGEIKDYCEENNITYFACNTDNTKQIRRTEVSDEFSQKAVDLSVLSDDEILSLASDLTGFENVKGEVLTYADCKFLKLELKSEDSGGNYILTQYITVKKAKKIILTFYTAEGEDLGYIDGVFSEQFKAETDYKPFVIIGTVLFAFAGLVAAAFIIKDLKRCKE